MRKRHAVELTGEQRQSLERLVNSGRESARKITRARVLLKADAGEADEEIVEALGVGLATVGRVRRRFAEGGLDAAVERRPQPPRPDKRKLDGDAEARLVTLACSTPPAGHGHWTPDLLADRLVSLKVVPAVSRDTVGRVLKKTRPSPG
jgi:transposase